MRRWRDRPDRGGEGWIGVLGEDEALKKFTFEVSELHWVAMDPKLRVGGESGPEVAERCTRLWRDLARCVTKGMNPLAGMLSLVSRGAYLNNEATWLG
ncbi:hypothetical protein B296_00056175 [Ensete ventricosum]|uniref:Uncharacterized protein n=1 Tax=Ensete ventricosum TaxID=4639 RepID=A0A426XWV2_ENSVE|nr:hypothetical protein B296_00056175 [Ensete ventricosum]